MVGNLTANERLRDLMVKHRVVVETVNGSVPRRPGKSAIVSRVPDIRIDSPAGKLETSESTLRLEDADGSLTFRARPGLTRAATDSKAVAAWVVDERGKRIPASVVDLESRTIRLPIKPDNVEIISAAGITDPMEFLVHRMVERPMEAILAMDGPPIIRPGVREGLQAFFKAGGMRDEESYLRKERGFLERLGPTMSRLAERLSGRIREIDKRLEVLKSRRNPPELPESEVIQQLSMLSRVVGQRACGWIRFDGTGVTAAVNPNPDVGRRGRGGIEFRISHQPHQFTPDVLVWTRTGRSRNRPRCLGHGVEILTRFQRDRDLFGMVDVILNYIDTNKVGAHRRSPARVTTLLDEMVDETLFPEDLF